MLDVLRRRDFALLWTGGLISIAGDWVLYAALPFFVYERTGSTIATAGMVVAELAPGAIAGSVAGVFVDRWDRKRVLVVSNVLQAVVVAFLLLGQLWIVFAVAAVQSTVAAFAVPAEDALLPSLVGVDDLVAANALTALNNRLARLLGLPLGGLLLGLVGLRAVVLVDGASFVVAALLIAQVHAPVSKRIRHGFSKEWVEGVRVVRNDRTLLVVFGVLGLMTFGGTMLDPLQVAWVRDELHGGPQTYAALMTTHAASGILATLFVARFRAHASPRALMGWTSLVAGGALVVKFNVPLLPVALALSVLGGMTSVISAVGVQTLVQQVVPEGFRGRVFGALGVTSSLLSLAGAALGGVLAEAVGTVPVLDFASVLVALGGVVVLRAFK
jgi:MFS family permease